MKKISLSLTAGLLVITVSLFAADGDLIVNGNVGIGTTTPAQRLEIKGTGRVTRSDNANYLEIGVEGGLGAINVVNPSSETYNQLSVNQSNNAVSREVLRIDTNGNVGIGTTNTVARLTTVGPRSMSFTGYQGIGGFYSSDALGAGVGGGIFLGGMYNASNWTEFAQITGVKENSTTGDYSGDLVLYTRQNGNANLNESMRIQGSTGNVGIGNTLPSYLLTMESSGGGYYSASDHSFHNGSSIRWKKDIAPIGGEEALGLVSKLQGTRFTWKKDNNKGIGMIAEDVGKVLPELVEWAKDGSEYADGLNYANLVAVLVEAIKEQQKTFSKEIESLKVEIERLKGR